MTYMYAGEREFGLDLARRCWENLVCRRGYTWDLPNIISGREDDGARQFGADDYQDICCGRCRLRSRAKTWAIRQSPAGWSIGSSRLPDPIQHIVDETRVSKLVQWPVTPTSFRLDRL